MKVKFDDEVKLNYGFRQILLTLKEAHARLGGVFLTPGQAMRLAARLQRWAIGKHPTRKIT